MARMNNGVLFMSDRWLGSFFAPHGLSEKNAEVLGNRAQASELPIRYVEKRCVTAKCQERWEQLSSADARGEVFINFQHVAKEEAKS